MKATNRLYTAVYLIVFASLFGGSFLLLDNQQPGGCNDCLTYLSMAEGDFDESPVRRYRVIIPAVASLINRVASPVIDLFMPYTFHGDFSLHISFMLVNSLLMALFGLLVFRLSMLYTSSPGASFLALIALLTCRWTFFSAALPIVDSLYLVSIALLFLGIKSGNARLVIISILVGPWAKEAYIFMVPIILLYGPLRPGKRVLWLLISGILVFSFRFLLDHINGFSFTESLAADTEHTGYITESLSRLLSFHGVYDLLSVAGLWILFLVPIAIQQGKLLYYLKSIDSYLHWYLLAVVVQMLLSTDIARMFYLSIPWFVVLYAKIISGHPLSQRVFSNLPPEGDR